jgi:hypothetical protein
MPSNPLGVGEPPSRLLAGFRQHRGVISVGGIGHMLALLRRIPPQGSYEDHIG